MTEYKVLVCGGRYFEGWLLLKRTLDRLKPRPTLIIHGGARGADLMAKVWAEENDIPSEEYKADWNLHKRAAGPIRNQKMLKEAKPDLVVAFPGERGTAHMVRISKRAKVEVLEVPEVNECPTCGSPVPELYPAVQFGGEVGICIDPYHDLGDGKFPVAEEDVK